MRKLQNGPDYSDPEVRHLRHVQKVINFVREHKLSSEDFKYWLACYLEERPWAGDEFDRYEREYRRTVGPQEVGFSDGFGKESFGGLPGEIFGEAGGGGNREHGRMPGRDDGPLEPWDYTKFYRQVER